MAEEPVNVYRQTPILSLLRIGMGGGVYGHPLRLLRMGMVVCSFVGDPPDE